MRDLKELEDKIRKIRQKSEVYIVSPADVEYYSRCLHLRQEIWNLLGRIESNHLKEAMKALKHLQPFARKRSVVELERVKYYGTRILVVGHSIYTTWTYRSPEEYSGRRSVNIKEMFDTIFERELPPAKAGGFQRSPEAFHLRTHLLVRGAHSSSIPCLSLRHGLC